VINGQGPAPKSATPALFAKEGFVTGNGPLGATIPAMLDAMAIALETKGTMHLEQVLQPAIELADGFPMYEFLQHFLISERKATGGVFSYDDLASFHGQIEKPTTTNFHGFDVYKAGPWNQGPALLQTLNILEGVDLKSFGANSADYIHYVHEAIKLAYADRNAYYGDPAFARVPIAGLLSKPYAAERRTLIGPRASLEHRPGDPFRFDPSVTPPPSRYTPHSQGEKSGAVAGDTTCVDV